MHIIFVDDEPSAHINFNYHMKEQSNVASLNCFFTADEALLHAQTHRIDCAFLDIELNGTANGLDLAKQLRATQPQIEVVFVTAYEHHARTAYQVGGRAYLTKPYDRQELTEALQLIARLISAPAPQDTPTAPAKNLVKIRTFGNFDLIIDGRAVPFKTAEAKEALAFLIDQMGSSVSGVQIFYALWEKQTYNATNAVYVRRTMRALRDELEALGIADVLISGRNSFSIDIARLDCDSIALLNGDAQAAFFYRGVYMQQYAWSETTLPLLNRAVKRIGKSKEAHV